MALSSHRRAPALPPHMLDAGALAMQSEEKVPGMLTLSGGGEISRWARALRSLSSRGRLSNETWVRGGGSRQSASHFTPKQCVRRLLGSLLPRHRCHNEVTKTNKKKTKFPHHHARKFFHCAKLRQPPTPAERHKSSPILSSHALVLPKQCNRMRMRAAWIATPAFTRLRLPRKPSCQHVNPLDSSTSFASDRLCSKNPSPPRPSPAPWLPLAWCQCSSAQAVACCSHVKCKNLKAENISRLAFRQAKFSGVRFDH